MGDGDGCGAGGEPSVAGNVLNLLAYLDDGVTVEAILVDSMVQASQSGAVCSCPGSRGPEVAPCGGCNSACTSNVGSSDVAEEAKVLRASTL